MQNGTVITPHAHRPNKEHEARKQLRVDKRRVAVGIPFHQFHGNGLRKGRGQNEPDANDAKGIGKLCNPHNLSQDRRDCAPKGAAEHTGNESKDQKRRKRLRRDPEREAKHGAEQGRRPGHADAAKDVAEVAQGRAADGEAKVEQGVCHGALGGREADGRRVDGQPVQEDDVPQLRGDPPDNNEEDLDAPKVARVEAARAHLARHSSARPGVEVAQQERREQVGGQRGDGEHAVRPAQVPGVEDAVRDDAVNQAADARARRRHADGQTPARGEPGRQKRRGGDVGEAHAPAETEALGEDQVPDPGGEGGREEGYGYQHGADENGPSGADASADHGDEGRDEEGLGDGEAAHETEFEVRGLDGLLVGRVLSHDDRPRLFVW
ncbi:hypothetical protein MAJ_09103, partial [Metarhizium majus ARSEF 297]